MTAKIIELAIGSAMVIALLLLLLALCRTDKDWW